MSDRLYFEEISLETVYDIYNLEKSYGVIVSVGGQIPNNIALDLYNNKINILGTSPVSIDNAEDRNKFSDLLDRIHVDQPEWAELNNIDDVKIFSNKVGFPVLIRPSYVLSGASMKVINNNTEIEKYLKSDNTIINKDHSVVISKFITDAKEIEVDAVADKGVLINYAISEHLENAGTHSGDATIILPAQKLYLETIKRIKKDTKKIAKSLHISGPFNIQFISKNNEIKVIECNLRASRSFPFVSKTLGINFIELATNIMIEKKYTVPHIRIEDIEYICVKTPVFSFNRLPNVDPMLGVEMASTGEVAAFGYDIRETYLKSLISTGFKIPKKNILISINDIYKYELIEYLNILLNIGYNLYGSNGTCNFFKKHNISVINLDDNNIIKSINDKIIDCVINIPNSIYNSNESTFGYKMRITSINNNIPLITNIKCSKLFISSLDYFFKKGFDFKSWNELVF